jgi:hypothetical protein
MEKNPLGSLRRIARRVGVVLIVAGAAMGFVGIVCGLIVDLVVISSAIGFWGFAASFLLLPITLVAGPFYAGFAWHNWLPLFLCYGSGVLAPVVAVIGALCRMFGAPRIARARLRAASRLLPPVALP